MADAVGLDAAGPGGLVPLWACLAFGDEPFLHGVHRFRVFTVSRDDDAEFFGDLHEFKELLISDVERALVGQKDLETADAVVRHQIPDLLFGKIVESHHSKVKGVIAARPHFRKSLPLLKGRLRLVIRTRADHLNDSCRPARKRRLRRGGVIINRVGAHEGQVDMHVRIDEPGEHVLARCIDDLRPRAGNRLDHLSNPLTLDQHIGHAIVVRRNDPAALDEDRHQPTSLRQMSSTLHIKSQSSR